MKGTSKISHFKEWKEVARWIKFEETVESEGNRWSKPHVSTPSLAGWMQLRKFFRSGLILLDIEARDMGKICDIVVAALASTSKGIAATRTILTSIVGSLGHCSLLSTVFRL